MSTRIALLSYTYKLRVHGIPAAQIAFRVEAVMLIPRDARRCSNYVHKHKNPYGRCNQRTSLLSVIFVFEVFKKSIFKNYLSWRRLPSVCATCQGATMGRLNTYAKPAVKTRHGSIYTFDWMYTHNGRTLGILTEVPNNL